MRSTDSQRESVNPAIRTSSDLVLEQLKDDILTGHLKPGTKLVERELTERYGVSRTPLREALKQLVASHLATNVPYHGVHVRHVSLEFTRDVYEVRAGLEGLAGALAAERANRNELRELGRIFAEIDRLSDARPTQETRDDIMRYNTRFHRSIAVAAHNPVLLARIDELWASVNLVRFTVWQEDTRIESSRDEHAEILEALRNRDAELTRRLCYDHSLRAWTHVASMLGARSAAGS